MAIAERSLFAKRRRRPAGRVVLSINSERIGLLVAGREPAYAVERPVGGDLAVTLAGLLRDANALGMAAEWVLEPGQYSLMQVDKPAVPAAEWAQALRWKVRDLLPFPVEEAVMDAFEVPGLDSRGRPPSLYLAVARKEELRPRIAQIAAAGLHLERISVADLAWAEAARQLADTEDSLAALVLDPRGGSMLALREQCLFVARRFEFDADDQRALREPQDGRSDRLFERVALELQRTLDYFDRSHQRPAPRRLLLLPGVDGMQGLDAALRRLLGLEVQRAEVAAQWPVLAAEPEPARLRLAALAAAGGLA